MIDNQYFNVIIAGSRTFDDYVLLRTKCDRILSRVSCFKPIRIISGGAKGADQLGERYARERFYEIKRFIPDWDGLGKKAGYVRNKEMAENANALIAFYDGESKGTRHMIDIAKEKGIPIRVIEFTKLF